MKKKIQDLWPSTAVRMKAILSSVFLLSASPLSLCMCVYCSLSLSAPTFLARAFLFLMENKDWRMGKMGTQNEKHGVSDLRPRPVHL